MHRSEIFRWVGVIAALALGGFAVPSASAAVSSSISPVADAFVTTGSSTSNLSGNNYGAAGALGISATGLPNGAFQSVIRFDPSTVKSTFDAAYGAGNWTVQSVTLQLTAASPSNPIFNASAAGNFTVSLMQNNSWVEGTGKPTPPTTDGITYNSLPTYLGPSDQALGTFAFAGGTSGANTYTLSSSSGLTSDLSSGSLLSLRLFAADANVSYLFNSREFGTVSARPVFTVTAIPEPTGLAATLLGLSLLLRRRSRS